MTKNVLKIHYIINDNTNRGKMLKYKFQIKKLMRQTINLKNHVSY